MATASQTLSMMTGQASNGKSSTAITGNDATENDPTLTPSQRRKRPLSIIKEADADSDYRLNGEAVASKAGQSSVSTASAQTGTGKVSSPRRTSGATARCSPTIRKLTENFERSPSSSPSRAGPRVAPRPASTGTIGVRSDKASITNGSGSGTSSPRTSSPRTIMSKKSPSSVTKTHRTSPSSSPVARAASSSTSAARTSSPSQSSRSGGSGRKTFQEQEDIMSRLTSGKAAVPSKVDSKRPLTSTTKPPSEPSPSNSAMKNGENFPKNETSLQTNSSENKESPSESSQNEEMGLDKDGMDSCETSDDTKPSDMNDVQKPKHVDIFSMSPLPPRKRSLSPCGDTNSIPRDGGGLARIRETAERLKLTSPTPPVSSSPAQSPKFGHRVRFATPKASAALMLMSAGSQNPPVSRGSAAQGYPSISIPHITVTTTEGGVRGPPPHLGPSLPSNCLHSPASPPLTTIAESSGPELSVLDSKEDESNNNQTDCNMTDNAGADKQVLNQTVSSANQDVSNNNNVKSVFPYSHVNSNINYHNTMNAAEHSNRITHPRPTFLLGSRLNTSTHPPTSTALLPYYKLSSSAFFARRLSSGGSSICEEEEEEEDQIEDVSSEHKSNDNEPQRVSCGEGGLSSGKEVAKISSTSSSSSVLLSERGSSVSSLGSTTSIHSNCSMEPTSPPLLQQQHQITASDLTKLKETADKLRLSTRRDSTMAWRQKYLESPGHMRSVSVANGGLAALDDGKLTEDRKHRIDAALDWLREELQDMRTQDQSLARQLLTIRHDIHQLKLQRSTEEHQELIDDYWNELEELQEFSDVLDLPQPVYGGDNPLRNVGVTRLNLSARRFSAC